MSHSDSTNCQLVAATLAVAPHLRASEWTIAQRRPKLDSIWSSLWMLGRMRTCAGANGLREWSSLPRIWKRVVGNVSTMPLEEETYVALRFLQNVVSLDPTAVQRREYEVDFLAVWTQTAVARCFRYRMSIRSR